MNDTDPLSGGPDRPSDGTGTARCRQLLLVGDASLTGLPDDTITLDEQARHRRRLRLVSDGGVVILLDLAEARLLRQGDRLLLDDGRQIEVHAAAEALYEVRARDTHHLLCLSWHMGNRHLPTQIMDDHVRVREDAVIRAMIEALGGIVTPLQAPFDPEGGAYHTREHTHEHTP